MARKPRVVRRARQRSHRATRSCFDFNESQVMLDSNQLPADNTLNGDQQAYFLIVIRAVEQAIALGAPDHPLGHDPAFSRQEAGFQYVMCLEYEVECRNEDDAAQVLKDIAVAAHASLSVLPGTLSRGTLIADTVIYEGRALGNRYSGKVTLGYEGDESGDYQAFFVQANLTIGLAA